MINHRLSGRKFRIRQILMIKMKRNYQALVYHIPEADLFDQFNSDF